MDCPLCKGAASRVIYVGLPMSICEDPGCACLFGFWSFVAPYVPPTFDEDGEPVFAFTTYDDGYLRALWRWLTEWPSDES
jgi:hypothetical protein